MADLLTLNAVNKMSKTVDSIANKCMCKVVHHSNIVDIYCSSCGFSVPSTATEVIIEMWGQGGGGAGSCCCQWGLKGGNGGDYAKQVLDVSGITCTMCFCGCQSFNSTCCTTCVGSVGAPSILCLCSPSKPKMWCAKGGAGGLNNCHWMQSGECQCNLGYSFNNIVDYAFHCCCSYSSTFSEQIGGGLDKYFPKVDCSSFDEYRRGSLGFSGLEKGSTSCHLATGIGGASYAGGGVQYKNLNYGNWAFAGQIGNFPGGGGSGAGACGGGCCYGSQGGYGLIRVSWQ